MRQNEKVSEMFKEKHSVQYQRNNTSKIWNLISETIRVLFVRSWWGQIRKNIFFFQSLKAIFYSALNFVLVFLHFKKIFMSSSIKNNLELVTRYKMYNIHVTWYKMYDIRETC